MIRKQCFSFWHFFGVYKYFLFKSEKFFSIKINTFLSSEQVCPVAMETRQRATKGKSEIVEMLHTEQIAKKKAM